ncbi:MAG: glycosyltransferase family 4 protein [Candidatus Bathyarchaeota archaeon]|nr:glycosyltransferase family 4 protein [Candidatus Bathyarchaeota archaeon]
MDLSVCLVATEIFEWGRHGGFGRCTRTIGSELAERGVRVSVVVPRGLGQGPVEELDGMTVYSHSLYDYPFTRDLYERCDSDIYHSEGLSWGSRIAMRSMPGKRHLITFQNPRTREDWKLVNRYYPLRRRFFNALFSGRLSETARKMDVVYCQARYIMPKVKTLYNLQEEPEFLPNPVEVPAKLPEKAEKPTVCFLGRFDGEKRPELFFELAKRFPEARFVAAGEAHDRSRDRMLRRTNKDIPNLELPGFMREPEKRRLLEESWVLVNTSVSECLPVSFLEAAAQGCAILSLHDPDGFTSNFGYHVIDGDLNRGLRFLMEGGRWRERGRKGYAYVSKVHELGRVTDLHIAAYEDLLSKVG